MYSNGVSEEMIGRSIKNHNIPRHKLILLSKCYGTVGEEPGVVHIMYPNEIKKSKDYVNQGGLSRQAIFNAVNRSLERLGTDYLDLLQIHRFDGTVPVEETMKALHDLVQSGKVRYIGMSSHPHPAVHSQLLRPYPRNPQLIYIEQAPPQCGPTNSKPCKTSRLRTTGRNSSACKTTTRSATAKKSAK